MPPLRFTPLHKSFAPRAYPRYSRGASLPLDRREEGAVRYGSIVAVVLASVVVSTCSGTSEQTSPPTGIIGLRGGGGGQGSSGGGGQGAADTVRIGNNFYSPSSLTVPVGTTVMWVWSAGDVTHTVTDNADTTIRSPFQSAGTYQRTFTTAGAHPYHCSVHGLAMSGTIIAQ
jgi:plastocyanin